MNYDYKDIPITEAAIRAADGRWTFEMRDAMASMEKALRQIRDGNHEYPNSEWRIASEVLFALSNAAGEPRSPNT